MNKVEIEALESWVGRSRECHDSIAPASVAALSASLDHACSLAGDGDVLPPCWHWLFFLEAVPASGLGNDGHPRLGDFLPPVPLPRRMWAGSRLNFIAPLRVGDKARRVTTIDDVKYKQGRSGDLVFLTLGHRVFVADTLVIEEEQDLVYRGETAGQQAAATPAPASAQWSRTITPDPVLLFRYSALTFNGHRIHYDREYACSVEGYSSLVIQGPLTATLLLDLLYRELPGEQVVAFEFRALRPLLEGTTITLQGNRSGQEVKLRALDDSGALAMQAVARLGG